MSHGHGGTAGHANVECAGEGSTHGIGVVGVEGIIETKVIATTHAAVERLGAGEGLGVVDVPVGTVPDTASGFGAAVLGRTTGVVVLAADPVIGRGALGNVGSVARGSARGQRTRLEGIQHTAVQVTARCVQRGIVSNARPGDGFTSEVTAGHVGGTLEPFEVSHLAGDDAAATCLQVAGQGITGTVGAVTGAEASPAGVVTAGAGRIGSQRRTATGQDVQVQVHTERLRRRERRHLAFNTQAVGKTTGNTQAELGL